MKPKRLSGAFTSMCVDALKLSVAIVALILFPALVPAQMRTAVVDLAGDVGTYTSIAVDANHHRHISYYDSGNGFLKLAYWDGAWQIKRCCQVELTSGISGSGRSTAIQLEHMGSKPLILFFDHADKILRLAIFDRDQNQWDREDVRSADNILQDLSLALDTQNQPHISFSEVSLNGSESVHYGKKSCLAAGCVTQVTAIQPTGEGTWSFEPVNAAAGNSVSLVLDAIQNLPWISYYDPAYGLRLAQKSATGWSVQTVDPGWETGLYNAITLDPSNYPHVSYYDATYQDLKFASMAPQALDVWIKDCPRDNGTFLCTPICAQSTSSPDIWFENHGDRRSDGPVPGVRNTLKARVRNRSFISATNVTVKFYFGDAGSLNTLTNDNAVTLIGTRRVTVAPNSSVTASVRWTPPLGTWCIGVVLDHPADPPAVLPISPLKDNNFAVRCFRPGGP